MRPPPPEDQWAELAKAWRTLDGSVRLWRAGREASVCQAIGKPRGCTWCDAGGRCPDDDALPTTARIPINVLAEVLPSKYLHRLLAHPRTRLT